MEINRIAHIFLMASNYECSRTDSRSTDAAQRATWGVVRC